MPRIAVAAMLLALSAGMASANVQWYSDYKEALKAAKERNVPVFITFSKDG